MIIVVAACGVAAGAFIAVVVDAALAFPRLPPTVPLHFDLRGKPGSFGPKAVLVAIFVVIALLVAAQVAGVAASFDIRHREVAVIDAAMTLALLAYVQHAIFNAILHRGGRLAVGPVYVALAALIATYAIAARL